MDTNSGDDNSDDGLQIVVDSPTPKKHSKKTQLSEIEKEIIACVEKDLEENLEEKAAKANLTAQNVKNIIKELVTNEDVVALVRHAENPSASGGPPIAYEPKYTRAKKKLLLSAQTSQPDVLSQPPPAEDSQQNIPEDEIHQCNKKIHETQSETGAKGSKKQNTAKKKTRKSQESCIPPDIATDMYDMDCDDDVWLEFLSTFTKPLEEVTKAPEDDDHDPEYNVLADEEIDEVDKREELRADRGVTVSRKELNCLMAELFEFADMYESSKLKESEKKNDEENVVTIEILPQPVESIPKEETNASVTTQHVPLLAQQIRQHIQMLVQNFLLTYAHPELSHSAVEFKKMLYDFQKGAKGKEVSFFDAVNLHSALEVVEAWEELFATQSKEVEECKQHVARVLVESVQAKTSWMKYLETFPSLVMKTIVNSNAFLYPRLLPTIPFKSRQILKENSQLDSEDCLIALFLEQAIPYLQQDPKNFAPGTKEINMELVYKLIHQLLMPHLTPAKIRHRVNARKKPNFRVNPIQFYYRYKRTPPIAHFVEQLDFSNLLPPCKRSLDLFSVQWREFIYCNYHYTSPEMREKVVPENNNNPTGALVTELNQIILISSSSLADLPIPSPATRVAPKEPPPGKVAIARLPKVQIVQNSATKKKEIAIAPKPTTFHDMPTILQPSLNIKKNSELKTTRKQKMNRNDRNNTKDLQNNFDVSEFLVFPSQKASDTTNSDINNLQIHIDEPVVSFTIRNRKNSSDGIMGVNKRREKLWQFFIINLVKSDPEQQETQRQKDENEFFDKLRNTLSAEDYDKLINILDHYDETPSEFFELFTSVQALFISKYDDFLEQFLLFLIEIQARETEPLTTYFIKKDMDVFKKQLKIYLKDRPSHFKEIVNCLMNFLEDSNITIENVKNTVLPLIKENATLTEWFLHLFSKHRLPIILLNSDDVTENVNCKNGTKKENNVRVRRKQQKRKGGGKPRPSKKCIKNEPILCEKANDSSTTHRPVTRQRTKANAKQESHVIIQHSKQITEEVEPETDSPIIVGNESMVKIESIVDIEQNRPASESIQLPERVTSPKKLSPRSGNEVRCSKKSCPKRKNAKIKQSDEDVKSRRRIRKNSIKISSANGISDEIIPSNSKSDESNSKNLSSTQINIENQSLPCKEISLKKKSPKRMTDDMTPPSKTKKSERNRSPKKKSDNQSSWTREEDKIILNTFQQSTNEKESLKYITSVLPNRTKEEINSRFTRLMNLLQQMTSCSNS